MDEHFPAPRTVHVVLPATHRPLCGYEEERPTPEGASAVACARSARPCCAAGSWRGARASGERPERSKGEGGQPGDANRDALLSDQPPLRAVIATPRLWHRKDLR